MSFRCFGYKDVATLKLVLNLHTYGNITLHLFSDLKSLATSEETKIHQRSWKDGIEIDKTAKFIAGILYYTSNIMAFRKLYIPF